MNRIDELRQQIDACRAGSDDLHLPELAGLARSIGQEENASDAAVSHEFDRSQRFDRSVVSALHDVSVPAGLLERLLAQTSATGTADAGPATLEGSVDVAVASADKAPAGDSGVGDSVVVEASARRMSRRRWLIGAGTLGASALAVGAVVYAIRPRPRDISQDELVNLIPDWTALVQDEDGWQAVLAAQPPDGFPVKLAGRNLTAWKSFQTAAGERAVAYDMTPGRGQPKVLLFAVSTNNRYMVPAIPGLPLPGTTGGVRVSAWQPAGGLLFVLLIEQGGPPIEYYLPRRHTT